MHCLVQVASIAVGHPAEAAAIGHFDRKRSARARHARDKPGRLQEGYRNLVGKGALRCIIEMALEEGQPRSQTKTSPRWGDAGQFTLLSHHRNIVPKRFT
jgi:hypothetical protein